MLSTDVLVVGEMGIGNTTSAAALGAALFGGKAADWVGRGTGVDDAGLANKARVVAEGLASHAGKGDGLETLRRLGAIRSATARAPAPKLDAHDIAELDRLLARLQKRTG